MLKSDMTKPGAPEIVPLVSTTTPGLPAGDVLHAALWETTTDVVLIIDAESTIVHANPRCASVLGYTPETLVGRNISMLIPRALRDSFAEGMRRYLRTRQRTMDWNAVEMVALHKDGHELPMEVSATEVITGGRHLFVGFLRDISLRKQHEAQSQAGREWAEATLRSIADAVVTLDLEGRIASLSVVAEHLTGWKAADAVGRPFEEVVRLRGEDGQLVPPFPAGGHLAYDFPRHAMLVRRDQHEVPVEGTLAPIMTRERQVAGTVGAFRNVAHARRMTAELSYQASHDGLTGLVNRKAFERLLEAAVARARELGDSDALLYLDLDQFKVVNDIGGHVAGDALLQQLASLLKARLRDSDHIARLGGDEFGVLLHNCDADAAVQVAESLRKTVADFNFVWETKVYSIGVSIGVVHLGQGRLTLGELLARADEACYVAKSKGRNAYHVFTPGDQLLALHHNEMEWTTEIRAALAEDRLFLCSQDIVRVGSGAPAPRHVEVLLRMRGRDGQTIAPMAFLPAAERYGLMITIDRWVIARVLEHLTSSEDPDTIYSINLSGSSVADPTFSAYAGAVLSAPGVDARRICFELAETTAVANLTDASRVMRELKQRGVRFALDDFGSGMSSFTYLRQLPVDYVKIDGSFVRDIAIERVDRAMVESINHLAHVMGIATVAEWVDNHQTLEILAAIGVDYAQGFGISRPQPFE